MLLVQWVDGGRGGGPPTADHAIILREIITGRYDNKGILHNLLKGSSFAKDAIVLSGQDSSS